jgi:3-oxoacyl-[acyl-carrier-protein] synthase-3
MSPPDPLIAHLLSRLRQVQGRLGRRPAAGADGVRFADAVDSMGFVEFLALVADDCGVSSADVERAAGHRFGTVQELASALRAAGLRPTGDGPAPRPAPAAEGPGARPRTWLAATTAELAEGRQPAADVNALLRRPPGWLERHAGIHSRRVWGQQDALEAGARTARACLDRAGLPADAPGALLVTSEAPPVTAGLAAAVHQRLRLPPGVPALDLGGACTGFLHCLWTARRLLSDVGCVLVVAVEAPSRWLALGPGPEGEAAALFGDGAAACVLTARPPAAAGPGAMALADVLLGTDGGGGHLLQVRHEPGRGMALAMRGVPLAERAVRAMAGAVRDIARRHSLETERLAAVVAHGGNGRMPALLARQLGLPAEHVWSETAQTGNLGSASLPVAWAARSALPRAPVLWTAVGAGLHWGAALLVPIT